MSFLKVILPEGRLYVCNYVVAAIPSVWLRMWFYRRMMDFDIAESSSVFLGAWFYCAGDLIMGEESVINENCRLDTRGGITLKNNVVLAANVTILTADHNPREATFENERLRRVIVEDYVFVCTGALILPGVTLGEGCMVGAGSVVTKSVEPYSVVAGNPARPIGKRPNNLSYPTAYRRLFH